MTAEPGALRLLETSLYTRDLEAARAFYADVLGLEMVSQVAGRHVFLRCGDSMLLVFHPEATSAPGGSVPPHGAEGPGHAAFAVPPSELEAWKGHLAEHGVSIEAEVTWPSGGRSVYFRDPAGNSLELATPATWRIE